MEKGFLPVYAVLSALCVTPLISFAEKLANISTWCDPLKDVLHNPLIQRPLMGLNKPS